MSDSVRVSVCTDAEAARWDEFLGAQAAGSFYHRFGWKTINERSLGHETFFLAATRGTEIVGVFPLVLVSSRLFGKILCSMPFVNYGGPCASEPEVIQPLLDEAITLAKQHRVDYLEMRTLSPLPQEFPTALHKVSMTVALDANPDTLWNAFDSKHRKNIRRVYKNNLRVTSGHMEHLDVFYRVLAEAWREHGTPIYRKQYFADVLATFPDQTRIFMVHHENTPVATAFVGYHDGTIEGMWLGTDPRFRHLQPSYVLYWEMIKDSCERGYKTFHLGRSTVDSGSQVFKDKWNTEAKQLYWSYYLSGNSGLPQVNVDNPKYKLAMAMWRRLPLCVTTSLGPFLARGIP